MAQKSKIRLIVAPHVNLTKENQFVAIIIDINLVGGSYGWWIDTNTSIHVYYDRVIFKTYTYIEELLITQVHLLKDFDS